MKIALTNLCKTEDFAKHKNHKDSIDFLNEENINYYDFYSSEDEIIGMVDRFNEALNSDADLIWIVQGGLSCIQTLDRIDWKKVISSNKKFYGLSDFTHFSTKAVSLGLKCYYGQGLKNIKQYFPTVENRKFISDFLKTGNPNSRKAKSLFGNVQDLDINKNKVVGGHMLIFGFMQNQLNINLKDRYLFLEYHHSAIGEGLNELGYYLNQILFVIKDNPPKGFILGKSKLTKFDSSEIDIKQINDFLVSRLSLYNLPIFYVNHYNNVITFS